MNNFVANTLNYISVLMVFSLVCLSSCQKQQALNPRSITKSPGIQSNTLYGKELVTVNSILIAPPEELISTFRKNEINPLLLKGDLYQDLIQALQAESDVQLVGGQPLLNKFKRPHSLKGNSRVEFARQVAESLKADAVLLTTLNSYVERKGSSLGVTAPAAVDFEMELVRVTDSKVIWGASYHFQDQALSENLLNLSSTLKTRAGQGWVSARDAIQFGFAAASKELATARQNAFAAKTH